MTTFSQHITAAFATLPHIARRHRYRTAVRETLLDATVGPHVPTKRRAKPQSKGPSAWCACGWAGRRCALVVTGGGSACPRCGTIDARGFWR